MRLTRKQWKPVSENALIRPASASHEGLENSDIGGGLRLSGGSGLEEGLDWRWVG